MIEFITNKNKSVFVRKEDIIVMFKNKEHLTVYVRNFGLNDGFILVTDYVIGTGLDRIKYNAILDFVRLSRLLEVK